MAEILAVYDRFHPQIGGMERMIDELTRCMSAGHRVTVLAEHAEGIPRSLRHGEVDVVRCRWWDGSATALLGRTDVMIGFGYTPYSSRSIFPLRIAARARSMSLRMAWCPTYYPTPERSGERRRKAWKRILPPALRSAVRSTIASRYHDLFAQSFAIFALTEVEQAHWTSLLPATPVHLCGHGVGRRHQSCTDPSSASKRLRERFGPGPIITSIGRVSAHKNQAVLVRAMPRVLRHFPEARLVLAGSCADATAGEVRRLASDPELTQAVIFAGPVSDPELCELYAGSSCIVHPSRHEASGLTPLEALAHGTPAVHSGQGALARYAALPGCETVDRLEDPAAWAERIVQCLGDAPAGALRAKAGRQVVLGTHTWENMAETIEAQIHTVLPGIREVDPTPSPAAASS